MGVPPIILHFIFGFSIIDQPFLGYPHDYGNILINMNHYDYFIPINHY